MSPYKSLPIATAPYYREARVTIRSAADCLPNAALLALAALMGTSVGGNYVLHSYKTGRAAADSRSKSSRIAMLNAAHAARGQCLIPEA